MAFCQTKRYIIYRIIDTQLSPVVFISLKYRVHIYVCQAFVEPEKYEKQKSDTRYWSSFARSDAHFPEDWVNIKIRLPIECIRVGERNQYLSTVYSIYHFIDESHHQSGLAFVTVHDYSFGEQSKLRAKRAKSSSHDYPPFVQRTYWIVCNTYTFNEEMCSPNSHCCYRESLMDYVLFLAIFIRINIFSLFFSNLVNLFFYFRHLPNSLYCVQCRIINETFQMRKNSEQGE